MNAGALLRAVLAALLLGAVACGGGQPPAAETSTPSPVATPTATATATATPTVPPPPADSLAGDLAALLEMRDALAGSGALNWDARLPGEDWDGVTITGAPPRVTALDLADRRLSGTIPPMLRRLAALTTLDLSGNRLATIPPELGGLAALTTLDLSGNRLATIPPELGGLAALTGKGSAFAFDAASELLILEVEQIDGAHNGGALLFGPDGMLYLSLGDGGSGGTGGDPYGHGQNPRTLLGTVVRIDVRGATEEAPYAIPPDNPFRDREDARPEVWAYGLRNPWRMSLDRATGLLWAGDAGEVWREEVNIVRAGANYGWNVTEGSLCISPPEADCDRSGITPPLHDYDRSYGCAIIGGYVYRGVAIPTLRGWYLFSDYCNSGIRAIPTFGEVANSVLLWDGGPDQVVSFAEDSDGELYVISQQGARIYRVIADPAANGTPGASR